MIEPTPQASSARPKSAETARGAWHAADWSSFVAGVAFAAVGAIAVVAGGDRFTDAVVWIWSGLLLGLGVALLLRGGDRGDRPADEVEAVETPAERPVPRPEGPPDST